jgi:hypothetical protein
VVSSPLTFLMRFSILISINLKASFMAVSEPPYNSSKALVTSSVHTIWVVKRAHWAG